MGNEIGLYNLAYGFVGEEETPRGSNRSKLIDQWNKSVGAPVGSFWCASFVSAMTKAWAMTENIVFPIKPSASCDDWFDAARASSCISRMPAPGAIGLILSANDGMDATHIFILGNPVNNVYPSVEGNSNSGGSRNGYCVAHRDNHRTGRNPDKILYIHWWKLIEHDEGTDIPWQLKIGDDMVDAKLIDNTTYVPLRKTITMLDGDDSDLTYEGKPMYRGFAIKSPMVVIDQTTYVALRSFLLSQGKEFKVNAATKIIEVKDESSSWV
jgi:hypothetical protein